MPSLSALVVAGFEKGIRLDRYVAESLAVLSRSQLKNRLISSRVNGKTVKPSRLLYSGDRLEIEWADAETPDLVPQDIPLDILYEDDRVLVIDKPQGLVVHPGAGNRSGTFANALLHRLILRGGSVPTDAGVRPGIVHRLDKDTSGVLIAAYDERTLAFLADQFKARTTQKTYLALVVGSPPADRGVVSTFIARDPKDRKRFAVSDRLGKKSVTLYRVAERFSGYALVVLRPKTGRTHQLRVHLRHLGCPILGDPVYGRKDSRFPEATLMLHAVRLKIRLPGSIEREVFTAPMPERMTGVLRKLRAMNGNARSL